MENNNNREYTKTNLVEQELEYQVKYGLRDIVIASGDIDSTNKKEVDEAIMKVLKCESEGEEEHIVYDDGYYEGIKEGLRIALNILYDKNNTRGI